MMIIASCKALVSFFMKSTVFMKSTDRTAFLDPVPFIHTKCASRSSQRTSPIWLNQDLWTVVISFLDSKSILQLALTNLHFLKMAMDESVWKTRCIKEIGIPDTTQPLFSWRSLYVAAVDGSHSYSRRDCKAHIDWMRIGVFSIESGEIIASDRLCNLNDAHDDQRKGPTPLFAVSKVKNGPWIAGTDAVRVEDLHLLRCSVCNDQFCQGTMQTLEARHWELFLDEKYTADDWEFDEVATYTIPSHTPSAAAGIFDKKQFMSKETLDLLNLTSWNSAPSAWQPRGRTSKYAAASSTNLQQNDGLQVRFYVLRAGLDGSALAIRVTQQLV